MAASDVAFRRVRQTSDSECRHTIGRPLAKHRRVTMGLPGDRATSDYWAGRLVFGLPASHAVELGLYHSTSLHRTFWHSVIANLVLKPADCRVCCCGRKIAPLPIHRSAKAVTHRGKPGGKGAFSATRVYPGGFQASALSAPKPVFQQHIRKHNLRT